MGRQDAANQSAVGEGRSRYARHDLSDTYQMQRPRNGVGNTTARDCYRSGISPSVVDDMCANIWEWYSTDTKPARHELKGGGWTSPFDRATPSSFNDAAAKYVR